MEDWLSIFSQTLTLLKNHSSGDKKHLDHRGRIKKKNQNWRIEQQPVPPPPTEGSSTSLKGLFHRMLWSSTRKDGIVSSFLPSGSGTRHEGDDSSEDDSREEMIDRHHDESTTTCSDGDAAVMPVDTMPSLLDVSPRSNDSDAYDDMFATPKAPSSSLGALCGMSLCLTGDGDSPSSRTHGLQHDSHNMSRDVQRVSDVLGEPLRLVLDLKSRRVPPKVWSRLIDSMRSRGLVVEGIGSFDMDELRVIAKSCSCPLTPILFFHSVGDLQRACHANEVSLLF
jgi:hypothetical protein